LFTSRHWPSSFYPRACDPGRLVVEERFGEATIAALRKRGHKITVEGPWSLGRVCAVGRDGDKLSAPATPRLMQAYAIARGDFISAVRGALRTGVRPGTRGRRAARGDRRARARRSAIRSAGRRR